MVSALLKRCARSPTLEANDWRGSALSAPVVDTSVPAMTTPWQRPSSVHGVQTTRNSLGSPRHETGTSHRIAVVGQHRQVLGGRQCLRDISAKQIAVGQHAHRTVVERSRRTKRAIGGNERAVEALDGDELA